MAQSKVGQILRDLRRVAKGSDPSITATTVASLIGFTPGYLMHIETGKALPSKDQLNALLNVYRASDAKRVEAISAFVRDKDVVKLSEISDTGLQIEVVKDLVENWE